jgi:hypothetical protein
MERCPFHDLPTTGNGTTIREKREEATGTSAVCKPRLPSLIVTGSRSIIEKEESF